MRFDGALEGNILMVLPKLDAFNLVNHLLNQDKKASDSFTEMEQSALVEVGNILSSSFITALSDFTQMQLKVSVPGFAYDMAGAIFSFPLSLYGYMGDMAFLIETQFTEGLDKTKLHFFLIPDDESFKSLLKAIGVNVGE
jgi:chemotaxis protein CheC